jgi:hypothetical protein
MRVHCAEIPFLYEPEAHILFAFAFEYLNAGHEF